MTAQRAARGPGSGAHVLTVAVEDYYHVAAFHGVVRPGHWERFESRLVDNCQQTLALLQRFGHSATFFVLGCVAERHPEVVRMIADAGHEVASRGFLPRTARGLNAAAFRDDLRRTREVLEAAGSNRITGHRWGSWIRARDLWMLDVLMEEGYRYDASVNPILGRFKGTNMRYEAHPRRHSTLPALNLWEFPVSSMGLLDLRLPIAGGNYTRQLHAVTRHAVSWWDRHKDAPLVFYFMPWELDRDQPQLSAISPLNRLRQYRNLERAPLVLEEYLGRYQFQAIGDYLGIPFRQQRQPAQATDSIPELRPARKELQQVGVAIPLYNEEANVAYLARTMKRRRREFSAAGYWPHLVLVDDCSQDDTWRLLQQQFCHRDDCTLVRHERNRGVAAAILTGVQASPCEIVCSIDCDLSYDPCTLVEMIPLLEQSGADLVTASPYHPSGQVINVPSWRLLLSQNLSRLYSAVIGERMHTFTSCCRVYRRSAVAGLTLSHEGFLGVAELLLRIKLRGGKVLEHPAVLESRLFGQSKMKTAQTVRDHLGLLAELLRDHRSWQQEA